MTAAVRTRSGPWPPRSASSPVSTALASSPAARPRYSRIATLNTLSMSQKLDTIWEEEEKRYMHHYNFPGYSTGEAKPQRSTGRREYGHGALAEKALEPVIPER